MKLSATDRKKLVPHLDRTIEAIEEILDAGLTTASDATWQTFGVTFQEASRMKLLRLGSTLRSTHEEVSRYVKDDPKFSQSRLMFFLNRSWLLCKGIQKAVAEKDSEALDRLLWTAPAKKVKSLTVVCVGVVKKIAAGTFCAFEFRLRSVKDGRAMTWSTVFPMKAGTEIPAEGYLHLPQKQKFTAACFLERREITIANAMVSEGNGVSRIQLLDDSKVTAGDEFENWTDFLTWDAKQAAERVRQHEISPFDVDVELQEEVVFDDYQLNKGVKDNDHDRVVLPLTYCDTEFDVSVSSTLEGQATMAVMKELAKKKKPVTLYGLLHYASCRLVVQPLTLFEDNKPNYITISDKAVDRKALLSALKFT